VSGLTGVTPFAPVPNVLGSLEPEGVILSFHRHGFHRLRLHAHLEVMHILPREKVHLPVGNLWFVGKRFWNVWMILVGRIVVAGSEIVSNAKAGQPRGIQGVPKADVREQTR
jgi:hypothetical protein